ncbi:hypothetical protein [Faecalispora anaeroviscerum]|uniref:hypothetical protein n=1 Tax=Faecalispora anaeroviscerum TaxID=2991836 RepID=UPI0024BB3770|nr:hypothetical protein [Faecalispora anaeroviscerum]
MEQEKNPEIREFSTLMTEIRTESKVLEKMFLTQEEKEEENRIISEFDITIQSQAFNTLNNLKIYQLSGWRDLVDGGDDSDDGANPVSKEK